MGLIKALCIVSVIHVLGAFLFSILATDWPHEIILGSLPRLERYSTEHAPILDVASPLIEGMRAHTHVGINLTNMHSQTRGIRNPIIGFTLGIVLLGALVGTILSRRIVHPLTLLAKSMRDFGSGKAQEEIDLRGGGPEVAELTQSFNQMITERRGAQQALLESEARFRTLVEKIPAITYTAAMDKYSTTQYISPQIESIL